MEKLNSHEFSYDTVSNSDRRTFETSAERSRRLQLLLQRVDQILRTPFA